MKTVSRVLVLMALMAVAAGMALAQQSSAQKGQATFDAKCAMCHGKDGKGQTAMGKANNLKDLGSGEVQNMKDSELQNLIESGKGKMPAYKGKLNDEQLEQVVAYIRTFKK